MRIIAGDKRGTVLSAPKGMDTRPTLDRVKESLFGILQFSLFQKSVLDLFAGSGGLGLEALSRGAAFAAFCDSDKAALAAIKANVDKLGYGARCAVYPNDYESCIKRLASMGRRFDIVFLDPPYRAGYYENAASLLLSCGVLNDGFLLIMEHASNMDVKCPDGMTMTDRRKYGEVTLSFFAKREDDCE